MICVKTFFFCFCFFFVVSWFSSYSLVSVLKLFINVYMGIRAKLIMVISLFYLWGWRRECGLRRCRGSGLIYTLRSVMIFGLHIEFWEKNFLFYRVLGMCIVTFVVFWFKVSIIIKSVPNLLYCLIEFFKLFKTFLGNCLEDNVTLLNDIFSLHQFRLLCLF